MSGLRRPLNQLVLLGLICQGFSWDGYFLAVTNALLWLGCLTIVRRPVNLAPSIECALIALGITLGYVFGEAFGVNTHFAIGHGLTLLQLARLLRPLNRREQVFSVIVSLIHIGVGCSVLLDMRFVMVFAAASFLIPRTLLELEAQRVAGSPTGSSAKDSRSAETGDCPSGAVGGTDTAPAQAIASVGGLGRPVVFGVMVIAVAFFLVFPRNFLGSPLSTHRRGDMADGGLLSALLNPALGSGPLSHQIVMQIEGEDVGYLRCLALDTFDGRVWKAEPSLGTVTAGRFLEDDIEELPEGARHRRVRVKQVGYLGHRLPADGNVLKVDGRFFRHLKFNEHDILQAGAMWNSANNIYEYWSVPELRQRHSRMASRTWNGIVRRKLLDAPAMSPRLEAWVASVVGELTDPYARAKALETHFQDEFRYRLGTPSLDRLNPIEDFVLNAKEGHCERFASALTYLLRKDGIPARIMVGYVPGARNWLAGGYQVRFKDAHAWTEAYFEDRGWVTLDATPRSDLPLESGSWRGFLADVEFAWYLHVVNFGGPTQRLILGGVRDALITATDWARGRLGWLGLTMIGIAVVFGLRLSRSWWTRLWVRFRRRRLPQERARHFYGEMIRAFHRQGVFRAPSSTPAEFLESIARQRQDLLEPATQVTQSFCRMRYGGRSLAEDEEAQVQAAVRRIRRGKRTACH